MSHPHTLGLVVDSPLPLHANHRLHWAVKAARTRRLRGLAHHTALATHRGRIPTPTHLTVHLGWPDNRRRDAHNAMPTIKACIDGIVDAGWLNDDNDDHLTGPDLRSHVAGRKGFVVITFSFQANP